MLASRRWIPRGDATLWFDPERFVAAFGRVWRSLRELRLAVKDLNGLCALCCASQYLRDAGLYETPQESAKREEVLKELGDVFKNWVKTVAREKGYPRETVEKATAAMYTFGSYRLGVFGPGSDIDAVAVGPVYCKRRDQFFGDSPQSLEYILGVRLDFRLLVWAGDSRCTSALRWSLAQLLTLQMHLLTSGCTVLPRGGRWRQGGRGYWLSHRRALFPPFFHPKMENPFTAPARLTWPFLWISMLFFIESRVPVCQPLAMHWLRMFQDARRLQTGLMTSSGPNCGPFRPHRDRTVEFDSQHPLLDILAIQRTSMLQSPFSRHLWHLPCVCDAAPPRSHRAGACSRRSGASHEVQGVTRLCLINSGRWVDSCGSFTKCPNGLSHGHHSTHIFSVHIANSLTW